MKRHCHGTRNVLPQLIQATRMRQALPLLQKKLSSNESEATLAFLNRDGMQQQDKPGALGKMVQKELPRDEVNALKRCWISALGVYFACISPL